MNDEYFDDLEDESVGCPECGAYSKHFCICPIDPTEIDRNLDISPLPEEEDIITSYLEERLEER